MPGPAQRFDLQNHHTSSPHIWQRNMGCNQKARGSLGARDIADKLQESRLRWYGHVKRRPPDYVGNLALQLSVPGRRSRGRPKTKWLDVVSKDMKECQVSENDVVDRAKWRRQIRKADPTTMWDK
ncbi:hypothetical protein B5X24_HaOG201857 [Helicoverpa armigera]|nr:hypothetical protein B5X24_HaOG201857 [Helicoverpa armigera]